VNHEFADPNQTAILPQIIQHPDFPITRD